MFVCRTPRTDRKFVFEARCRTWLTSSSRLAVVFGLVGVFLVKAAIEFDPRKAVGLDATLAKLAASSYGPFLLGIVAAGLMAFGVYSLTDARYRRI